jgi:hypothetical protein
MRRIALLGLFALLPGCQFVGDPTDGLVGFLGDTHTWRLNATRPPAVTENERMAEGEKVKPEPLLAETGEVWPGPPASIPTLQDVQKLNNLQLLPPPDVPSTPAPAVFPQNAAPKSP